MSGSKEAPKSPQELFPKQKDSTEKVVASESEPRVLPLGAFSKFVLREQPKLLSGVRSGDLDAGEIAKRQKELIESLDTDEVDRVVSDPDMARIAALDLSFAMSGLIFSGITPPDEVIQLNKRLSEAAGLPEKMTVEKIVSINSELPFDEMRTFMGGDASYSEKAFYYVPHLIDKKMKETIGKVIESIDLLKEKGSEGDDEVVGLLTEGAENMTEFPEYMRAFKRMPREHFDEFRPYLRQYPDGARNVSGAFIGFAALDIRLTGLTAKYNEFLEESMEYFPINVQPDIQSALEMAEQGHYLVAQCERLEGESQKKVARALIKIIKPIIAFRRAHFSVVHNFLPEELSNNELINLNSELKKPEEESILIYSSSDTKGTGGFPPGPLFRNMLKIYEGEDGALKRLRNILEEE